MIWWQFEKKRAGLLRFRDAGSSYVLIGGRRSAIIPFQKRLNHPVNPLQVK